MEAAVLVVPIVTSFEDCVTRIPNKLCLVNFGLFYSRQRRIFNFHIPTRPLPVIKKKSS